MKEKVLYIVLVMLVLIGVIVYKNKGFNLDLTYADRQELIISFQKEIDESKIKDIAKSVLEGKEVRIQNVGRFRTSIQIISTNISDEEKQKIIEEINKEYEIELSDDDINFISVSHSKLTDILKPYIKPAVATILVVLIYSILIYNKIGIVKVALKITVLPIIIELSYYALIVITRLPFGKITNAIALGIYIMSIFGLTIMFQNEKESLNKEQKEND